MLLHNGRDCVCIVCVVRGGSRLVGQSLRVCGVQRKGGDERDGEG